jgi:HEAT repeat protein
MSSRPYSEQARGLVRSLGDLFAGRPPRPVTIPEPSAGPNEDRLLRMVRSFLAADPADRPGLASALRFEAAEAPGRSGGDEALADAVERLARSTHVPGDAGRELARDLVTPAVARLLTERLRHATRDEARRDELVAAAAPLGADIARALVAALEEAEDRSVRRALLDALVAAAPRAPEVLADMVRDRRWFVVRNAVTVLGEIEGEQAVQHLTQVLAHTHPRVRREAVMALARIGSDDAAQLILGMLDDPDEGVRAAAAMTLGVLEVGRGVRPLLDRLEREERPDVQVEILRALGQLRDPGAVTAVEKRAQPSRFSRTPVPVRIAAFRALAAIGTPHARAVLREGLDDREPEVRTAVRAALRERMGEGSGGRRGPSV